MMRCLRTKSVLKLRSCAQPHDHDSDGIMIALRRIAEGIKRRRIRRRENKAARDALCRAGNKKERTVHRNGEVERESYLRLARLVINARLNLHNKWRIISRRRYATD